MAYSTQRAVSDGTLGQLTLSIEYFDRSEITVLFNGVTSPLSEGKWNWAGPTATAVNFTPVVPNGVEVMVKRTTQLAQPLHQYTLGAQFVVQTLDENFKQLLRIAQDTSEGNTAKDFYNDIDMHGYRIANLGTAVQPGDAIPLSQYQADSTGAYAASVSAAASAVAAKASSDFAATVNLGAYRNVLINGDFRIAQRSLPRTGGIIVDRWLLNTAGAHSATRNGPSFFFETDAAYMLTVTGSGTATDSNVQQRIEAAQSRHLAGHPATLSCWLYNGTAPRSVSLSLAACTAMESYNTVSVIRSQQVTLPTGWSRHVVTFDVPTTASLGLLLTLMGGFGVLGAGQEYSIGNVQLEKGAAATPFERRPTGIEMLLCQRYYQTVSGYLAGYTGAGVTNAYRASLPVPMRAIPSVVSTPTSTVNCSGSQVTASGPAAFTFLCSGVALGGYVGGADAALDAEL